MIGRRTLLLGGSAAVAATPIAARASSSRARGRGYALVRQMVGELGLGRGWAEFFLIIAYSESRGHPRAADTSKSAIAGASRSYQKHADAFVDCGRDPSEYVFGTGGLFGQIPTFAALTFEDLEQRCRSPRELVTDPFASQAAAVEFADRLMRWPAFRADPTFGRLRAMWRLPSSSDEVVAAQLPKYQRHARAIGIDPAFLEQRPKRPRMTADQAYSILTGSPLA